MRSFCWCSESEGYCNPGHEPLGKNSLRNKGLCYQAAKPLPTSFPLFLSAMANGKEKIQACDRKQEVKNWLALYMLPCQLLLIIYTVLLEHQQAGQFPDYVACGHFCWCLAFPLPPIHSYPIHNCVGILSWKWEAHASKGKCRSEPSVLPWESSLFIGPGFLCHTKPWLIPSPEYRDHRIHTTIPLSHQHGIIRWFLRVVMQLQWPHGKNDFSCCSFAFSFLFYTTKV